MVARRLPFLAPVVALLLTIVTSASLWAQASPVIVTPALGSDTVPTNGALDSMVFTVKNSGTRWTDVYVLSVSCTAISCPTANNPNPPGPFTLAPQASATTYVKFYHPTTSSSGTVSLTATDTSGVNANTGTANIVTGVPYVSLAASSPNLSPAADGVIYEHATPVFGSMGVQRALSLVYNSATVRPTPIITVDASNSAGGPYPTVYQLQVQQVGGPYLTLLNGATSVYYTAGTTTATRMVAAIDAKANGLATGAYPVTVAVTAYYSGQGSSTTSVPSRILVNARDSTLGVGVFIAGFPRLKPDSPGYGMLLLDGDGGAAYFDRTCSGCSFVSPAGVSSTLTTDGAGYRLTALDGSYYTFDASGLAQYHYSLPNVQDLRYTWNSPSQPSGLWDRRGVIFALSYSGPGGTLSGIADVANRTTSVSVVNNRLTKVTDPDGLADSLAYTTDSLLTSVKNRAGGLSSFAYNVLRQQDSVAGPSARDYTGANVRPTVATTTAALVAWQPNTPGTSSAAPKANVRPDTVMASITDPLAHVTRVAQDRFGLPTRVVDALNDTTTITRDTLGNVLVVVQPNGHKTVAVYNGYPLTARNDTTAGQYLSFQYDSSTSHRLETIRGGPVRLDYFYNTASDPGPLGALKMEYRGDTLGSGVWPPAGGDSLAHHYQDGYGRDTMVVDRLGHAAWWRYDLTGFGGNLISGINAQGSAATYTYNSYGLPATSTVPTRGVDSAFYDVLGRTTRAANPLRGSTQWAYSALGVTRVTDAKGQVYKFDLNAWGLDTARYDLGDTTKADRAWYDVAGNLRRLVTRRGDTITVTYDALNRLVKRAGPDFPAESLYYCPRGTCLVAINTNGRDSITYDLLGRVASAVQVLPDGTTKDTRTHLINPWRAGGGGA